MDNEQVYLDDPNLFGFVEREQIIKARQRALVDAIRLKYLSDSTPIETSNQMVGGRFINSPLQIMNQGLQSGVRSERVKAIEAALAQEQQQYANTDQAATTRHIASRPQVIPGLAGPVDPNNPQALGQYTPTTQDTLNWATKGLPIPSRRATLEKLIADLEIREPEREENRRDKILNREDVQAARAEERRMQDQRVRDIAEAGRIDSGEQKAADRVAREELERLRQSGAKDKDDRKATIKAAVEGKQLTPKVVGDIGEMDERANMLETLSASFKDEYSGPVAAAKSTVSPYVPGMDTSAAQWWRDYKKQQELIERHALFGATLTKGEQGAWRKSDISEWMRPEVIRENLATRAELANKVFANSLDRLRDAGYDVKDQKRTGPVVNSRGGPSTWSQEQRDAVQRDIDKLTPGTKFILGGKSYTKE